MDEIQTRLRAATDATVSCHETWHKDPKDAAARESLMEAVHELRKVAARLEIEIAVSERDEMAAKPIPIPPHRSSRKGGGYPGENFDDNIGNSADNIGNGGGGGGSQGGGGFRDHGGGGNRSGGSGGQRGPRRRMGMSGPHGGGGQGGGNPPPQGGGDQG